MGIEAIVVVDEEEVIEVAEDVVVEMQLQLLDHLHKIHKVKKRTFEWHS